MWQRSVPFVVCLCACVSDAGRSDVEAVTSCNTPNARECVAVDTARVCQDGHWVSTPCGEGNSCSRANGTCSKGTLSCLGTLVCDIDCDEGDNACAPACAAEATVPAVDALGSLNACQCEKDCWPILCGRLFPWPTYATISACVVAACADKAATCVGGGPTGKDGCVAIRSCALACRGDVFCAEGCFATGTAEAQTTAAFYYMCVRQECGPDPESGCLFQAQANRCAELWGACQGDAQDSP